MDYVITSYSSKSGRFRTAPQELITDGTTYDLKRYLELLRSTCDTVMTPFED